MNDYTIFCLQIIKSDTRPHVKYADANGHSNLFQGLCGHEMKFKVYFFIDTCIAEASIRT